MERVKLLLKNNNLRKVANLEYRILYFALRLLTDDRAYYAKAINLNYFIALQHLHPKIGFIRRRDKIHCMVCHDNMVYICPYDDVEVIDEVRNVYREPGEGDIVIDAGAHYGFYTLWASAKIKQKGKIYAFEPCPLSFKNLLLNLKTNRIGNVIPMQLALSNYDGNGRLYYGKHSGANTLHKTNYGFMEVKVKKLDTLCQKLNLQKVNHVKIDVEGCELQVLEGAETTLRDFKPCLSIASYHYEGEAQKIRTWLQAFNYHVKIVEYSHIPKYNIYLYAE